jgi:hypothetical protein
MLVMRFQVWLVVVCVALSQHPGVAAAEGAPPETAPGMATTKGHSIVPRAQHERLVAPEVVTARVYSSPDLAGDVLRSALDVAQSAFVGASVEIIWKICGPAECNTPPSPAEVIVRFVPAGSRRLNARCLGEALIDVQKRTGVMATVYVDRVLNLARNLEIDHPLLLGRTIAHEIGHLLLATSERPRRVGLMREVWSRGELLAGRADHWMLQPFEAAAIRKRLAQSRSSEQHIAKRD